MNAAAAAVARASVLTLILAFYAAPQVRADESAAAQLDRDFARSKLQIATPDARLHTFDIWIADTDARRARGLMFVRALADDEGMLFIYPQEQPIGMWMKNTYIPLDMLFVAKDGRVLRVAANTTPHSLETIASEQPALAVVELKAGTAERLKIAPGARVMHQAFDRAR